MSSYYDPNNPGGYDDAGDFLTKGELRTEAQRLQQQQYLSALQADYLSRHPQDIGVEGLLHTIASEMPRDDFNKKVLDPTARAELWDSLHAEAHKRMAQAQQPVERVRTSWADYEPDQATREQALKEETERWLRTKQPLR